VPSTLFPYTTLFRSSSISGAGAWRQIKCRTDGMNIHCFPKNVAPGNVFSVELDLPFTRRIIVQHSAQQRAVSSHLLLFGKLLNRFVLFFLFFRSLNVICKEASAGRFKEV